MSVLIFHPTVGPVVQQAARALLEAGELDRLITSLCYNPASAGQRWLNRAARLIGWNLDAQLRRRAVTEVPLEKVECHGAGELIRLCSGRLDPSERLTDFVWERTEPEFDRWAAGRLRPGHTGVYGFEHSSLATFQRARTLGIRTAYDLQAPEAGFLQRLAEAELRQFPELMTPYQRFTARRQERRTARRRTEFDAATVAIAASRFTRDSFAGTGADLSKVRIVPYGAPPPVPLAQAAATGSLGRGPLQLVWAGKFGILKGAHYLLDAWRRHRLGRFARLTVFGPMGLPERLLTPAPENIVFAGPVPRNELLSAYGQADALVFPTLADGFGMVVTEAWSRGVPVIATDRAGAADRLKPHENGLLIPAASADAIAEAVLWCQDHRAELREMRAAALATAAGWGWPDYRRSLAAILREAGCFEAAA